MGCGLDTVRTTEEKEGKIKAIMKKEMTGVFFFLGKISVFLMFFFFVC